MSVAITCASAPGVASTCVARSTSTTRRRPVATSNVGCHSSSCWCTTSSSRTASVVPPWSRRELASRSSTTRTSRSTCSSEMRASSLTSGSSVASMISSSRIDSAVSGVRSWCDASDANCRSAASRRGHPVGAARELGRDEVDLLDARRLEPRPHLPGAELLRGRGEVDERGGQPVGLPDRHRDAGRERDDGGHDDERDDPGAEPEHVPPRHVQHDGSAPVSDVDLHREAAALDPLARLVELAVGRPDDHGGRDLARRRPCSSRASGPSARCPARRGSRRRARRSRHAPCSACISFSRTSWAPRKARGKPSRTTATVTAAIVACRTRRRKAQPRSALAPPVSNRKPMPRTVVT